MSAKTTKVEGNHILVSWREYGRNYCKSEGETIMQTEALVNPDKYHFDSRFGWVDDNGERPFDGDALEYRLSCCRLALLEAWRQTRTDGNIYRVRGAEREFEAAVDACRAASWDIDAVDEVIDRVDVNFERRTLDTEIEAERLRRAAHGGD